MAKTLLNGIKASHAIVTDTNRVNRGDAAARDFALQQLAAEYDRCVKHHPIGGKTQFHFIMLVSQGVREESVGETDESQVLI